MTLSQPLTIGVISDTHGILRPQAVEALAGVSEIIHAGDIGKLEVLTELQAIAPVSAVRGNVDRGEWANSLPRSAVITLGGDLFYLLHNLNDLDLDPAAAGFAGVIHGHSHQPEIYYKKNVLYLNPGSAGPQRFAYPVGVARLTRLSTGWEAQLIQLPG